jgi:hypothetical protein
MSDIENELRSCVGAFVDDVSGLIRQQALWAVQEVLNQNGVSLANHKPLAPRLGPSLASTKRARGEKRTPEELAQLTDQLYACIKGNSGQGIEIIAKALNTTTKELTLPVRKLITDKKIVARGQKRATRYYAR